MASRLRLGSHSLEVGRRTMMMGVLNVTPDSFSEDGVYSDPESAVSQALSMVEHGADIIDVGGESTRPGAEPVSVEEELGRVLPVVKKLVELEIPISVDTYKLPVAKEVLEQGADMVNDITGLRDRGMARLVSDYGAGIVIMHMKGEPRTMQDNPVYERGVTAEVTAFLSSRIRIALDEGVAKESIVVDPGIGFGKTTAHNLEVIRNLCAFKSLGLPLLIGVSRKSFIGKILDLPTGQRIEGTIAATVACVANGADIVRAHDVKECSLAVKVADAVFRGDALSEAKPSEVWARGG